MILIPLANVLSIETFKIGERLITEGKEPKKFMIISSGSASVISEKLVSRPKNQSAFLKGQKSKKTRNLNFSRPGAQRPLTPRDHARAYLENLEKRQMKEKKMAKPRVVNHRRTFIFDQKPSKDTKKVFYKKHVYPPEIVLSLKMIF